MTEGSEPTKTRRKGRPLAWVTGILVLLVVAVAGLGWHFSGKTIVAPDWLRDRIAAQVAQATPDIPLSFDDVIFRISPKDVARVTLTNVEVGEPASGASVILSEVSVAVAPLPLLRREIALVDASVTGVFLTLERGADGKFAFAGNSGAVNSPDLPTLIAQIDTWLSDPRFAQLDQVEANAVTLRYEDRRARRGWTADGGRISISRRDGTLRLNSDLALLTGGTGVATVALSAESGVGQSDLSFGVSVTDLQSEDIASQSPALAWLDTIRAPISGALRGYLDGEGALGGLDATLNISEGVLQPSDSAAPVAFKTARTYFSYAPASQSLNFTEIYVDSERGSGRAEGRVSVSLTEDNLLDAFVGQFSISDVNADAEGVFDIPLVVSRVDVDAQLRLQPFKLELGRIRVADPDLPLTAKGSLSVGEAGWEGRIDGRVRRAKAPEVLNYWPVKVSPKTRNWAMTNVQSGNVSNGVLALRFRQGEKPKFYLDFAFQDAQVRFARTLPPVTEAKGQFTLFDRRLGVVVDEGVVKPKDGGAINVAGSKFVIPDGRIKPAQGQLSLVANGQAEALFSFLDSEPINLLSKIRQPLDFVDAQLQAKGTLSLPLVKGVRLPDMQMNLSATAANASSSALVKGRDLRAKALDIDITQKQITVSGKATLDGVPFDGKWSQEIGPNAGPGQIDGQVILTASNAAKFGVTLPNGLLSGEGRGDLSVTIPKNARPSFSLSSNLAGIGVSIPAIGYGLSKSATGEFRISGTLGQPVDIDGFSFSAGGLETTADIVLNDDGSASRIDFERARLGGWLDAKVSLEPRKGTTPRITVNGGTLDMRRAQFGGGGGSGGVQKTPVTLRLDRLDVANGISLTDVTSNLTIGAGVSGEFQARMGKAKLTGALEPRKGGTAVQVKSKSLGDVLRATGILKTVVGGDMTLSLVPVRGQKGSYNGQLDVTDTRLQDAPAIGSLLDAISVVGIIDQLEGPGIYFQNVEARFRLTPDELILSQSSATGPSMGISMDGYYNLGTKQLDMQGVLSPIYILNGIGSLFTRRGEGLIGFNFNLTGPASNPTVAVNPLSVFTPGMFREIFRRPPPQPSQ